ncbi:MAG: alpha/beta fold hydrolase [Alphaproteobacteria bacterium]|nr:alpha/beta fold hydrolase [Alphaproteobacteria bacterium]
MEVINFGKPNDRPPLLFVHGSYCGAWIWTRYFIPAFEKAGWYGAAISLRGHGQSGGEDLINTYGIDDYVEDIRQGARLFQTDPVLIGHSLGGYLVQKYALDNHVSGQVLLAAPSLMGLANTSRFIAAHRPMLALQLGILIAMGPKRVNQRIIYDALFSSHEEAEKAAPNFPPLQRESSRVFLEMNFPDFRVPKNPVPTLALMGDKDAFVPEFEARYEAQFWGGKSKIIPNVPHGQMMADTWPDVAKEVLGWLCGQYQCS